MKKHILFLCTGNSCRSQMAEGLSRHHLGDRYLFYSAGVEAHGMNQRAVAVMKEVGIDIREQWSKRLDELSDCDFNLVVTVCGDARDRCPSFIQDSHHYHKGFRDPAKAVGSDDEILTLFREVRDEINEFVQNELEDIIGSVSS